VAIFCPVGARRIRSGRRPRRWTGVLRRVIEPQRLSVPSHRARCKVRTRPRHPASLAWWQNMLCEPMRHPYQSAAPRHA